MMRRGPSADDLLNMLVSQLDILQTRLQALAPGEWDQPCAPSGETVGAVVAQLAEELAHCCLLPLDGQIDLVGVSDQGATAPAAPPECGELLKFLERAGEHAVAVLTAATSVPASVPRQGQGRTLRPTEDTWPSAKVTAMLLAGVVVRRWDIPASGDRGPDPRAARLLLQALFPAVDDPAVSPAALLLHVTGRVRLDERRDWPLVPWALRCTSSGAVGAES